VDRIRVLHFVAEAKNGKGKVDVADIGARFQPDVALVSVGPDEEAQAAEHSAALGAALVIPHHHRAYGRLPAADLDCFALTLKQLAPGCRLQVLNEMQTIIL
jgi:L-ascorbate metabolism protein UlaG (beta-lactamase superfamily)